MISVSYGANDVGSKDFLPFPKFGLEFIEFHTIRVLRDFIPGSGSPSGGGPNEEVVTEYILGHKRSVIGMDAVDESVKS